MSIKSNCLGCAYRRPASSLNLRETVCHYLLDTGESRGCPARECTRWQPSPGCDNLLNSIAKEDKE